MLTCIYMILSHFTRCCRIWELSPLARIDVTVWVNNVASHFWRILHVFIFIGGKCFNYRFKIPFFPYHQYLMIYNILAIMFLQPIYANNICLTIMSYSNILVLKCNISYYYNHSVWIAIVKIEIVSGNEIYFSIRLILRATIKMHFFLGQ